MAIAVTPVTFGTDGQDEDVPHAAPVHRGAQISPGIPLVETQPASTEFGEPDDGGGKREGNSRDVVTTVQCTHQLASGRHGH